MRSKKRTTVSLEEGIIEKARAMMADENFGDFSGFLEQVIRDRWNQRARKLSLHDASSPNPAGVITKVSYKAVRKPRKPQ